MRAISLVLLFLCLGATASVAQETSSTTTVSTIVTTTHNFSKRLALKEACVPVTSGTIQIPIVSAEQYEQAEMTLTDRHNGKSPECIAKIFTACELEASYVKRLSAEQRALYDQPCTSLKRCKTLYEGECAALDTLVTRLQALQSWVDGKSGIKK